MNEITALIVKIFRMVPKQSRASGYWMLAVVCLSAIVTVVGIVSVMPFLLVLAEPDMIQKNSYLRSAYDFFGFSSAQGFLVALGCVSLALLVTSTAVRVLALATQARFVQAQRFELSSRIIRGYLAQPYRYFLDKKSSVMLRDLLVEPSKFVDMGLIPAVMIISNLIQALVLVVLLVLVDPVITICTVLVMAGAYLLIYGVVRPALLDAGDKRYKAEAVRNEAALESFSGIKVVKLSGRGLNYVHRFEDATRTVERANIRIALMRELPKYGIETVTFGGIVLIAIFMTLQGSVDGQPASQGIFAVLGVYAFAGYRILPALQSIYTNLSNMKFMHANIESLSQLLADLEEAPQLLPPPPRLPMKNEVAFDRVTFKYDEENTSGIRNVSLSVPAGSSIGIVGKSGAGKTTLVDILLGLLEPTDGHLCVDGKALNRADIGGWQQSLGYVPQDIILSASSVAQNIAFGVLPDEIDMKEVIRCAKIAQLHEFITHELDEGYNTEIGERGVRLSGGQRQRIGIARAMYADPDVLVFDEATSALDNVTEAAVMQSLSLLKNNKTVVIVAHRLSTIQSCDKIAVMSNGELVALAPYDQLARENPEFQDLIQPSQVIESVS